jgi:hypothetical protein
MIGVAARAEGVTAKLVQAFDQPSRQFSSITRYMSDAEFDEAGFDWAYYVGMSHAFKVNLRRLFSELEFAGRAEDAPH